jgi:hypothetical protein
MIETETTWKDSGYDCDHCGGRVLERTDRETGQPARVCYQCEICGCQWTLSGDMLRVGSRTACSQAAKVREDNLPADYNPNRRRWFYWAAVVLALLFLLRFGGFAFIYGLIPILLLGGAVYLIMQFGKEQQWW